MLREMENRGERDRGDTCKQCRLGSNPSGFLLRNTRERSELKMKKTWKEERSMEKDRGRNNIEIKINVQI